MINWYTSNPINSSPLVPHICVSKSSQHWLVAYAAPSHYLNQCWSIGPLSTNFSEIFIRIQNFSFTKIHMNISSAKMRPFCPGEDELMATRRHAPFIFKINPVRESFTVIYIELITKRLFVQRRATCQVWYFSLQCYIGYLPEENKKLCVFWVTNWPQIWTKWPSLIPVCLYKKS